MKLSDFDFVLPAELIAQEPTSKRDQSKLLVVKPEGELVKTEFSNLIDYLNPRDLIVFNDSKVIKAKLTLKKDNKEIGINLNKPVTENKWLGFAKPAKKLYVGDEFSFGPHRLIIKNKFEMGEIEVEFILSDIKLYDFLEIYGKIPLPLYIKRNKADKRDEERYQTVYSSNPGSVAAPTAGLHFTQELLEKIKAKDIETCFVTLHVGAGTFMPVKTEDISQHKMHSEYCLISEETAKIINQAKAEGRRIIAVGTTAMRTLESATQEGRLSSGCFETNIFITPGYQFRIVDMLVTNFHVPKSTLFMLVCAFAGYKNMLNAYQYAIQEKFRFFSYGDATLLYKK